jgi:glycogen operon protein
VQQDPVVSQVKLIAEPWDVGPGGYQVGNFPPQWTEWNGKYRDTVRDFWRGQSATLGEFASRLNRVGGPLRAFRPAPGGQHQLRHLS